MINSWESGIQIWASNVGVQGCFIGTDPSGMTAVGENPYGVSAVGSTGASAITVGGPQPADRNLIAPGVTLEAVAGATVEGNLVGTDATGAATLPIPGSGAYAFIPSVGGTTYIRGNVVAGGIIIGNGSPSAFETILQGNFIGTDATGTVDLGGRGSTWIPPTSSWAARDRARAT